MDDAHLFELIDGDLVERNMSGLSSQVGVFFLAELLAHIAAVGGGCLVGADCGLQIFGPAHPKWVRFPDAAYFAAGRLPGDRAPEGWITVVPDLVVEVVSRNNTAAEVEAKAQLWLDAGVRSV